MPVIRRTGSFSKTEQEKEDSGESSCDEDTGPSFQVYSKTIDIHRGFKLMIGLERRSCHFKWQ